MTTWTVRDILDATGGSLVRGRPEDLVRGLSIDSRRIVEGEGFVAIRGKRLDGHQFIEEAAHQGASCLIVSQMPHSTNGASRVPNDAEINILIDYAHTADALRMALLSLRELTRGRLIVVFGCGGDRDQTKRPVMGKMAGFLADAVVLTSDNPRTENPLEIIRQIKAGFPPGFHQFEVVPDREQAIATALASARRDDTVLIAGKGHEANQTFDHISIPFSDLDVVERWLGSHHHQHHQVAVSS